MEKVNMGSWGKLILKYLKFLKFVYRFVEVILLILNIDI